MSHHRNFLETLSKMLNVAGREITLSSADIGEIEKGYNINKVVPLFIGRQTMTIKVKALVEKYEDFEIHVGEMNFYYFKDLKITFYCLFDEGEDEIRTKKKHRDIINGIFLSDFSVKID